MISPQSPLEVSAVRFVNLSESVWAFVIRGKFDGVVWSTKIYMYDSITDIWTDKTTNLDDYADVLNEHFSYSPILIKGLV